MKRFVKVRRNLRGNKFSEAGAKHDQDYDDGDGAAAAAAAAAVLQRRRRSLFVFFFRGIRRGGRCCVWGYLMQGSSAFRVNDLHYTWELGWRAAVVVLLRVVQDFRVGREHVQTLRALDRIYLSSLFMGNVALF